MTLSRSSAALALALGASLGATDCGCGAKSGDIPDDVLGHCEYINSFADQDECREFRGTGWTEDEAIASCTDEGAEFVAGAACPYDDVIGNCVTSGGADDKVLVYVTPGDDVSSCAGNERACELFAGGTFVAGNTCGGANVDDADDVYDAENFYIPEYQSCVAPIDDVAGQSAGGQVCTWNQMSGCTEEGRRFEDYGNCEEIRTQRPYNPVPPNDTQPADDPRMNDPVYAAEVEWVKGQIESCACVCCHKSSLTPEGASIFDTEHPGNFVNSFTDWGLSFGANVFDSSLLGRYPAEENNGFGREISGISSTDQERMKRFFEGELAHRGVDVAEYAALPPQPEIFYRQAIFEPAPCEEGEGVAVDGTVTWRGGRARYLYVLAEGSDNPGNPPNFDKPAGTLWRVDTLPPAVPMKTGEVTYGEIPDGHEQELPVDEAAPAALVAGDTYVIYAFADIGQPMTRCTFTFGE
jgi:hypothetical protein